MKDGSSWDEGIEAPAFAKLAGAHKADVAIVGGGITGILSAYLLAKEGKKVVVLEKDRLGGGATGATTAFITQIIDTDLSALAPTYGEKPARKILESHAAAIDLIEQIIKDEHIDCDFVRVPNYMVATTDSQMSDLSAEYKAGLHFGLDIVRGQQAMPLRCGGYARLDNQAKFHPLKFLFGVASAAQKYGAQIYEHTEARSVEGTRVIAPEGEVSADLVIFATYEPYGEPWGLYFKKGMYKSYVLELATPRKLPEGIYEDLANPYHYFRFDAMDGRTRIIVGGEDHRADIPVHESKSFQALEEYCKQIFDFDFEIVRRWKGPILESGDGLALIGPHHDPARLYAFGFSGNGMTYAAIAAQIFRDYVHGVSGPWAELYRADRGPELKSLIQKAKDYLGEFAGGAVKNETTYSTKEEEEEAKKEKK